MKKEDVVYADNEIVEGLRGEKYRHSKSSDYLEPVESGLPLVTCPYCFSYKFEIGYGNYSCLAWCDCGHEMEVYSG